MSALPYLPGLVTASAAPAVLSCEIVHDPQQLARLGPAWTDLLHSSAANQPMLSPTWLLAWWQIYHPGRQLRLAVLRDGERLVGLAPLCTRRYWHRRCLPFHRLEPLGADVDEGDGVGSDYLNVVAERGSETRVAHALARATAAGVLGRVDELVLPAMDGDNVMPNVLASAFAHAGFVVTCTPAGVAPYIRLPASWDAYLALLSGSQRYYLRRSLRDFDAWAAGTARFERVATSAELAVGRRILTELHGERWQAGGAFAAPRFAAFHDRVLPALWRAGALQLLWLTVRGRPLAAVYNLVWNDKVLFYQGGRSLDVPAGIRPGIVLHAHAIRTAIAAGLREYDFLGGAAQYKQQLATAQRPLLELRAVRPRLVERLRQLMESGVARTRPARALLRRLRVRADTRHTPRPPLGRPDEGTPLALPQS